MKVYLAARYSRRLELVGYRTALELYGIEVTSRWLNGSHQIADDGVPIGDDGEALVEVGDTDRAAMLRQHFAQEDVADVMAADMVISFTEPPRSNASRGGRHVEYGIALALGKQCIVVGPRENVFHWLPFVQVYDTFDELRREIAHQAERSVLG